MIFGEDLTKQQHIFAKEFCWYAYKLLKLIKQKWILVLSIGSFSGFAINSIHGHPVSLVEIDEINGT